MANPMEAFLLLSGEGIGQIFSQPELDSMKNNDWNKVRSGLTPNDPTVLWRRLSEPLNDGFASIVWELVLFVRRWWCEGGEGRWKQTMAAASCHALFVRMWTSRRPKCTNFCRHNFTRDKSSSPRMAMAV
jgi:hypothetical protein